MCVALIADVFPPLRSSGAVQLRDLTLELVSQGHHPTVLIPDPEIDCPWLEENMGGVRVLRLKAPKTKDVGYIRRTIGEFFMPFSMKRNLRKSPFGNMQWDGVVWYSPTIFLGPLANELKNVSKCRSYLIIRDIFPEWAVDMRLMGKGLPYRFFKAIERYQYSVADVIGTQTSSSLSYFDTFCLKQEQRVEVLQNWLADAEMSACSITLEGTALAGRTIFVYAGNMGVAQGMDILLDLADRLQARRDVGFLFVGRGSDAKRLRSEAIARELDNVIFYDEIEPSEIPGLYSQCHVGIVALDPRHKTHNIPGKFLSYMQSGLPVLACINDGNDLVELINKEDVGRVCVDRSIDNLVHLVNELLVDIDNKKDYKSNCLKVSKSLFSAKTAVQQIVNSLQN